MIVGVRVLKDLWKENLPYFGNKANTLSLAMKWGGKILPGFCITFDLQKEYNSQLESFSAQIERAYLKLVDKRELCHVIVRSSVDLEDGEKARFPGIFRSISGVSTLPQLYQAIQGCVESIWEPIVQYYVQANIVKDQFRYFTVLVQEELQPKYAGLATTRIPAGGYAREGVMLAILTKGNNHELVKGIGPNGTYSFYLDQGRYCVRKIAGNFQMDRGVQDHIFPMLYQTMIELRRKANQELEVEWGYAEDTVYIFQIRFAPELTLARDSAGEQAIVSFSDNAGQGFKYQAMRFFQEQGLFPRKTLFFPREISAEEAAQAVRDQKFSSPVTVRFSKKGELGLPRAFLLDGDAAANYVTTIKQPDWSVIVYSSLAVQKSFELYVDRDILILECVPGMWESDSVLAADTVMLMRDRACFWLVKQSRNARYEDEKGVYTAQVPPSSLNQIRKELSRRIPIMYRLREIFSRDLPLNFHFVSDEKQDYFLNCRRTHHIFWEERYGGPLQVIENVADCDHWDGRSGILFRPKLRRGEELLLFQFIPFLKSLSVPIFVEFGILSHPAIMLRELGISVMPYFLHHNYYEISLEEI